MKKITLLLAFVACVLVSQAQLLLDENFNYTVGSEISTNGWTVHSGTTFPTLVTAPTITYVEYPKSGEGAEVTVGVTGIDVNRTFTKQTTGTVFISFLAKVDSATVLGDYFIHVGPDVIGTSFFGRTFVKADATKKLAFGIQNASGGTGATQTYTPFSYDLHTTYLIVLKVVVATGESSIIVNPAMGTTEPNTGWISNNTGTTLPINIGSVALRQGGATSAGIEKVDGIHVATSYGALFATAGLSSLSVDQLKVKVIGKKLSVENASTTNVEIFNAIGAKVQFGQLESGSIQLNDLSKGLYIVRV